MVWCRVVALSDGKEKANEPLELSPIYAARACAGRHARGGFRVYVNNEEWYHHHRSGAYIACR